jgi:hypothetical protein
LETACLSEIRLSCRSLTSPARDSEPIVAASDQDESDVLCGQTTRNSLANPRSRAGENCELHGALK